MSDRTEPLPERRVAPPFVQIATSDFYCDGLTDHPPLLFGLTEDGLVWAKRIHDPSGWREVSNETLHAQKAARREQRSEWEENHPRKGTVRPK